MRIGIIGSGAVGGLYGAMLARAGVDVHFLLHSDYEHVLKHGLRIDSVRGNFYVREPNVYASVDAMPVCDVVIIALKSTLNDQLDRMLPPVTGDQTIVLTLQNGLDVEADVARSVEVSRVLGGCCFLCSNKVGPGHIHHLDYGRIVFGAYRAAADHSTSKTGQHLCQVMRDADIDAHWTDDLAATRWRKLMWNIPFNGLSVIMDASTDEIIGDAHGRELAASIIREVHTAATRCGVSVPADAIDITMKHTESMVPYDSSMRLDDRFGRQMEVRAIFGNPLRAVDAVADASSVMPNTKMLYQLLSHRNARRQRQPAS